MQDVMKMVLEAEAESKRVLDETEAEADRLLAEARREHVSYGLDGDRGRRGAQGDNGRHGDRQAPQAAGRSHPGRRRAEAR